MKEKGQLGEERTFAAWRSVHLTDAQKADAVNYSAGDMLQFHQNAPGQKNGSRLVVSDGQSLPLSVADRFEAYRPTQIPLAVGDRLRITANGKTREGKHRLTNGSLHTVEGFTPRGDIIVNKDWIIAKEFGHIDLGYVVTSHASQGKSVDCVFVGQSSTSLPATNTRQFYVSLSRGKQKAVVFTDDKAELLKAAQRADNPMSAVEFKKTIRPRMTFRQRISHHLRHVRRTFETYRHQEPSRVQQPKEMAYGRD